MSGFRAIIFDFDGVLLESELELNRLTAELLTELGHETTVDEALEHFIGLTGREVIAVIEARIGGELPDEFHRRMKESGRRALEEGIAAVEGAIEFVRSLPPDLPKAVASSSSTRWIFGHLRNLGLEEAFGPHVYSGREHVKRGKPAPDLYIHAAEELGVAIEDCVILEDSTVGVRGALASGARVIGLAAGSHCRDGYDLRLRDLGVTDVAYSFDDVRRLLGLD
jgi:HAD superfamily hydrolase (TIGR01509 family)